MQVCPIPCPSLPTFCVTRLDFPGVIARDPVPMLPGLTGKDTIEVCFTKATNRPDVNSTAGVTKLLNFSVHLASEVHGYWENGGVGCSERLVVVLLGDITRDDAATAVPNVRVSIRSSGGLGNSGDKVVEGMSVADVQLQGSWGDVSQPQLVDVWALDGDGQIGIGPGDAILLRFDQAVFQVAVASRADVGNLLAFEPADWATNYTGMWIADNSSSMLIITVTEVDPSRGVDATHIADTAVGTFRVQVLPTANLTSLDTSSPSCNDSAAVTAGSWGDTVTKGGLYVYSSTALLLAVAQPGNLSYLPSGFVVELSQSKEFEASSTSRWAVAISDALDASTLPLPPGVPDDALMFVFGDLATDAGYYCRAAVAPPGLPGDVQYFLPTRLRQVAMGPALGGFPICRAVPCPNNGTFHVEVVTVAPQAPVIGAS
jgi:hypothetical protein